MKLVTNTVPVITNNQYPLVDLKGGVANWSKVVMAEAGTVFKVKAVIINQICLENSKDTICVDVNSFRDFFTEHELEV